LPATPAKPGGRGKAAAGSEAASRTAEPYWGGEGEAGKPRSLLAERAIIAVHAFGRRGSIYSKVHAMSERAHKDCKYCGDNILSSSMSSHLKQKHADEVAREEKQLRDNAAHCFGNAGKTTNERNKRKGRGLLLSLWGRWSLVMAI
jgi:hypothetical protein